MRKINRSFQAMSKRSRAHMNRASLAGQRFTGTMKGIGAGLGIAAAGLAAGVAAVDRFTQAGDNAAKTAGKLGIGVQALQELRYAAQRSGMSAQDLDGALQYLNKGAGEAAAGMGEARLVFKGLGISIKDANGNLKSGEQLMGEVAEAMKKLPPGAARTAVAMKLFGRSGSGMINMLKDGSEGLTKLREDARKTGAIIDEETARQSEAFQDTFLDLKQSGQGVWVVVMGRLLPAINRVAARIRDWLQANRELIATKLQAFITAAYQAAKGFINGLKDIRAGISGFWQALQKAFPSLGKFSSNMGAWSGLGRKLAYVLGGVLVLAIVAATKAVIAFSVALLANPITWIIGLVAGLAAAAYLIYDNWDKIKAWWNDLWNQWGGVVEAAAVLLTGPIGIIAGAVSLIIQNWEGIVTWFKDLWNRVKATFKADGLLAAGKTMLLGLLKGLNSGVGVLFTWLGNLTKRLISAFVPDSWKKAGSKLVGGLWQGIKNTGKKLFSWIPGLGDDEQAPAALKSAKPRGGASGSYSPVTPNPNNAFRRPLVVPGMSAEKHQVNGKISVEFQGAPPGTRIKDMRLDTDTDLEMEGGVHTSPYLLAGP